MSRDLQSIDGIRVFTPEKNAYCDSYLRKVFADENVLEMEIAAEQNGKLRYHFQKNGAGENQKAALAPLEVMSITKIFTSTLLIALMENGRLSAYEPVRKYIPDFPFDDVLIHHLMAHTSGLTGHLNSTDRMNRFALLTREFPLDTDFHYYSSGYDILADIIENLTGMDIRDFARIRIFEPLNMVNSEFASHQGQRGMKSTATDLLKFGRHILEIQKTGNPGILKPCSTALMFREHTHGRYDRTLAFFRKSQTRRFGRYFGDLNSPEAVGHAGASGCFFLLDPQYDTILIILTNGSHTIQLCDENFSKINNLLMGNFII